jgi:broad specificity phosphatase PhoE
MILYCVRHGESVYNAEGRIQGQSDVPLSELGRCQSEAVADAVGKLPVDAVYSSPLKRAMETARMIANRLGLEVRTDSRLKEINAGIFQDRLRSELSELYPQELARWLRGDPDYVIPGGESRHDLMQRGMAAFEAIGAAGHRHAAVVAHGRLLIVTLKGLLTFPPDQTDSLQNGSITTISLNSDRSAELLSLNEVGHLEGIGLGGSGDL